MAVLKDDATFTMPPWPQWYVGREHIRSFFGTAWKACGSLRLVRTSANAQPAFAVYERGGADGAWSAHSIHVLTLDDEGISAMTTFVDAHLFQEFGLPASVAGDVAPAGVSGARVSERDDVPNRAQERARHAVPHRRLAGLWRG